MGQGAVAATNIHANLPPHWRAPAAVPGAQMAGATSG